MTEIPEFVLTNEMKDAIVGARFKTTNLERTRCEIYDHEVELIHKIGAPWIEYQPEQFTNPARVSYVVVTGEPAIVAFVGEQVDKGRSKRAHDPSKAAIPF